MKNTKDEISKSSVAIFKSATGPVLDVRFDKETVWLSQKQMSELFDKGTPTINEHVKNIYKENELTERATVRKFRIVQFEGKRKIERRIDFYNLDVIISVDYRVKSLRGTQLWLSWLPIFFLDFG